MSEVLVTGATGFLGKYIIEELLENNYKVVALGRNKRRLKELRKLYDVEILECDLKKLYNKNLKVDFVIHAAALSTVWGKWDDFYNSNVVGYNITNGKPTQFKIILEKLFDEIETLK